MGMRQIVRVLGIGVLSLALAGVAMAASVHFKPHSPVFTDQGVVLLTQGSLAGLANADLTVLVTATAIPAATCTNRGGGTAPGQNPADVVVTGSVFVSKDSIQNGQLFVTVQTAVPTLSWSDAGCPNDNWQATLVDLDFTAATVTVIQGGVVVLEEAFPL